MSHEGTCACKQGDCQCEGGCSCGCSCGCDCGCGTEGHFQRRYQTKAEQVKALEAYVADLRLEVQAVEERLADLKK